VGDSAFRTDVLRTCASEGTEGRVERRTSEGRGKGGEGRQGRERRGGREERAGSGWGGGERRRERDWRPLTPVLSEGKKIPPLPLLPIGGSSVPPATQGKKNGL
jgi:hypothetical protein